MSESDLSSNFIKMTKTMHGRRIENMLSAGTPDCLITTGFVELKWIREWPVRASSPVRLDHYTDVQRGWLLEHWQCGGGAWLLLQVKQCWLNFEAPAAQKVGFLTKEELFATATNSSFVKPTSDQLCAWFPQRRMA